jgi:hypothetical protein
MNIIETDVEISVLERNHREKREIISSSPFKLKFTQGKGSYASNH